MIFEHLGLFNFGNHEGHREMRFPAPDAGDSFVLVLAPNSCGKTTILRALRFLFYGEVGHDAKGAANPLASVVSERVREGLEPGKAAEAWVEARVILGSGGKHSTATLRRTLRIERGQTGRLHAEDPVLEVRVGTNPGERFGPDNGVWESRLRGEVPRNLFDWCFFEGEPFKDSKAGDLKDAVSTVLQLERWEEAKAIVHRAVQDLEAEEAQHASANQAYLNKRNARDGHQAGIAQKTEHISTLEAEKDRLTTRLEETDRRMRAIAATAEAARKLYERKRTLETEEADQKRRLDDAESNMRRLVLATGGLPFLSDLFAGADKRLSSLRRANLLPPPVAKSFIEQLLAETACVCGRKHDTASRACLEKYLQRALESNESADLKTVSDHLAAGRGGSYQHKVQAFRLQFPQQRAAKESALQRLAELKPALAALDKDHSVSEVNEYDQFRKSESQDRERIREIDEEIRRKHDEIRFLEGRVRDCESELRGLAKGKGHGDLFRVSAAAARGREVLQRLDEGMQSYRRSLERMLSAKVEAYYGPATMDGTTARVNQETLLPQILGRDGGVVHDLGGGMKQVLEIAFVIALAEVRRELNDRLHQLGLGARSLGEQAFFLDSPLHQGRPELPEGHRPLAPRQGGPDGPAGGQAELDRTDPENPREARHQSLRHAAPHQRCRRGPRRLRIPVPEESDFPSGSLAEAQEALHHLYRTLTPWPKSASLPARSRCCPSARRTQPGTTAPVSRATPLW